MWFRSSARENDGFREEQAYESCSKYSGVRTRRDPLSAVPTELQLKFQDSGITVTNWDRIRGNRKPNY